MKFTKYVMLLLFAGLLLNMQCNDDDGNSMPPTNCGALAVIDGFSYQNAATSPYTINSVTINEECLVINFTATGCDGSTWTTQLMDSDEIMESDPPQRAVKLFLINNEACLAEITQVQSFDLTALQIEGENEIVINIDDFSESVTYTY